ncbi:L-threonine synthase [Desulforamulus reducens MI-1]|uniref:Threonine synthase n=1 Tax=Desulforamulus reducens (strain ATCC BAA-1160 / DSM 100696 / MI-1) TaxID=349161 RepID=A4J4A6_DESRM|nr:threonine synthase [Desulforamulus reducens]ABO49909.1 L-threonine synthase [Desulforamulus reducens MI-1]
MRYESTRGHSPVVSSAEAITKGIAPDGGLYVPTEKVSIDLSKIEALSSLSYPERATFVLKHFLTDFSDDELIQCVDAAYGNSNFSSPDVAPVKPLTDNTAILELWHGPTCAFKDMALQILPQFLVRSLTKTGEASEIVILVATSGDTGKAALEGFANVPGTSIIVFFPQQGVSEVQRLQMLTQEGKNVYVVGVKGNFDDAQTGVKKVFSDQEFAALLANKGFRLSSANSINWGRLVPQIVYYFSAYADIVKNGTVKNGESINFVVPTGNFGNILAGYYAKSMGLPVNRLICASNTNNVLTDFIRTGTYNRKREFFKTNSPSMDILISSNLERLLYELTGKQSDKINEWMTQLKSTGIYRVDSDLLDLIQQHFWSDYATDEETLDTIHKVWLDHNYLMDTHTAVAMNVLEKYRAATGDNTYSVVASTASPFKFNGSVTKAILGEKAVSGKSEFALLNDLASFTNWSIPVGLRNLDKRPVLHQRLTNKDEIGNSVKNILIG